MRRTLHRLLSFSQSSFHRPLPLKSGAMNDQYKMPTPTTSLPAFDSEASFTLTQTPQPSWTPGSGASSSEWREKKTVSFSPYYASRTPAHNYQLLISGIVPRPIGFISTRSTDGVDNLAPMSYTQIVNHDPPILVVGFAGGRRGLKDSARNLLETGECTINIISEWFVEAANVCAIDAPADVDEWEVAGLTKVRGASGLKNKDIARIAESAFAMEAKVVAHHDWFSRQTEGRQTGTMVILEAVWFHAREDVINEDCSKLDMAAFKPVSRLGGVVYGRTTQGYELPRPVFSKEVEKGGVVSDIAENPGKRTKEVLWSEEERRWVDVDKPLMPGEGKSVPVSKGVAVVSKGWLS